ncbi:MAG: pyridoxamine 5'-phosphate oxidase family protein [Pseudomonadota bacterium]|nr:pyridoxamine 5'-phosphate oxidase family protein [Pseudomonadota bacterium]
MTDEIEIQAKFWDAIKSDRTVMVGLAGVDDGMAQPMTAQLDEEANGDRRGPIYFFTAKDTDLAHAMGERHRATISFAAKDHKLFAAVEGDLVADHDRTTIDRLWNPFVAAWFEHGKDDPKLRLLRFEPRDAQIWLNENTLLAGVKMLMGRDPKQDYRDKTAQVRLS